MVILTAEVLIEGTGFWFHNWESTQQILWLEIKIIVTCKTNHPNLFGYCFNSQLTYVMYWTFDLSTIICTELDKKKIETSHGDQWEKKENSNFSNETYSR